MAQPKTEGELIAAPTQSHAKLEGFFGSMNTLELDTPFDFSSDAKRAEAHWSSVDLSERNATASSLPAPSPCHGAPPCSRKVGPSGQKSKN
jgi:hypothetical protein